jgi:hypothetical protein
MAASCVYSTCREGVEAFDIVACPSNGTHSQQFVLFLDQPAIEKDALALMLDIRLLFVSVARHFRNNKHTTPIVLMTCEMHTVPELLLRNINGALATSTGKMDGLMITFRVEKACLLGNFKQLLRTLLMSGQFLGYS